MWLGTAFIAVLIFLASCSVLACGGYALLWRLFVAGLLLAMASGSVMLHAQESSVDEPGEPAEQTPVAGKASPPTPSPDDQAEPPEPSPVAGASTAEPGQSRNSPVEQTTQSASEPAFEVERDSYDSDMEDLIPEQRAEPVQTETSPDAAAEPLSPPGAGETPIESGEAQDVIDERAGAEVVPSGVDGAGQDAATSGQVEAGGLAKESLPAGDEQARPARSPSETDASLPTVPGRGDEAHGAVAEPAAESGGAPAVDTQDPLAPEVLVSPATSSYDSDAEDLDPDVLSDPGEDTGQKDLPTEPPSQPAPRQPSLPAEVEAPEPEPPPAEARPAQPEPDTAVDIRDAEISPDAVETPAEPEPTAEAVRKVRWWEQWRSEQEEWGIDGLHFKGKYGMLGMKLGGRVALDAGLLKQQSSLNEVYPDFGGQYADIRSAQLLLAGYFGPHIYFKAQLEGRPSSPGLRDVYVVLADTPWVENVRIGLGKEPFSMEYLTSFRFQAFMERSLMAGLSADRAFGALINDIVFDRRMTWAMGIFYKSASWSDFEFDSSQGVDLSGRITALPVYLHPGGFLHLGIGSLLRLNAGDIELSTRPETQLTDTRYVDTGEFAVDSTFALNIELAWQDGPLSVQSELTRYRVNTHDGSFETFFGGYASASFFLTGETRPYNRSAGTFGKVKPLRPFGWREEVGLGALEAAIRLSTIDLNSGDIKGGRETNLTAALNWYPADNIRLMLNYITGRATSRAEGHFHILQTRFLYSF